MEVVGGGGGDVAFRGNFHEITLIGAVIPARRETFPEGVEFSFFSPTPPNYGVRGGWGQDEGA